MGLRGRLRDPDSRRGRREEPREVKSVEIHFPDARDTVEEYFKDIVDQLTAAGMPLQQKDALAITAVANSWLDLQRTDAALERDDIDGKSYVKLLVTRKQLIGDVMKHLHLIGATPTATLRLIPPKPKAKNNLAESAVNDLLA